MNELRHIVRKTPQAKLPTFETQFWPVSYALLVTASLGLVAAMVTMEGMGRWIMVLSVPVALWVALIVLKRVNNPWLRRSLQFALLCSLALHLILVIFTALTDVFSGSTPFHPKETVRHSPAEVILVSRPSVEPIWEQVNQRAVEDPELPEARVATSTEQTPTPVQIEKSTPRADSQIGRRDQPQQQSTPRLDANLSQLRRSETGETPTSANAAAMASNNSPAARPATASDAASSASRMIESTPATSEPSSSAAAKNGSSSERATAVRRSESRVTELQTAPAPSQAPLRNRNPRVAESTAAASKNQPPVAAQPVATTSPQPADTSRRAESLSTPSPAAPGSATAQTSPTSPSSNPVRRSEKMTPVPTISDSMATDTTPRRSRVNSPRATTVTAAETPSLASQPSPQSANQPTPSATSITRSVTGGAQSTSSAAFNPRSESSSGPSTTSSDAQRRTESASVPTELQLMQNQSANRSRDLSSTSPTSRNAWQANTSDAALMAGSESPDPSSSTGPSAQSTTSSRDANMEVAAEPGQSTADSKPVKRTGQTERREDGGGGRPEIDTTQLSESDVARTRGSSQAPQLQAAIADSTSAERTPSSTATRSDNNPVANDTALARSDLEMFSDTGSSPVQSANSSQGESRETPTERRESGGSQGRESSLAQKDDDDDDEERKAARSSPRSLAPSVAAALSSGSESSGNPATTGDINDSRAEQDTAMGRRSTEVAGQDSPAQGIANSVTTGTAPSGKSGDIPRNVSSGEASSSLQMADNSGSGRRVSQSRSPGTASALATELAADQSGSGTGPASTGTATPTAASTGERPGQPMELPVQAQTGPAGLADVPSDSLGTPLRPSSRESNNLQFETPSRFVRDQSESKPDTGSAAAMARQAFQSRQPDSSSSPSTEVAIELGLEFLARHQQPDGSWSLDMFDTNHSAHAQQLTSNTAATGLAVLAFQGAGYHHRDFKYAANLQRALSWLATHQTEDGNLYVASTHFDSNRFTQMYSHGIAALALTEAYGMTQDQSLKGPCEKAIAFIVASQDPVRGGWRYESTPAQRQTDTSVTGWMMMALQSARYSGIEVPDLVWTRIDEWMDVAHDPVNRSLFRYDPFAENEGSVQRIQQRNATPPMTAVGLLMLIYSSSDGNSEIVQGGADYLLQTPPGQIRDTYYWYYATQVLRHVGGQRWQQWHAQLHPILVDSQEKTGEMAGSWNPYGPNPDRWGANAGRLYVTTMNLLSLEVDYRLLPIYERTTEERDRE